MFGSQSHEVCCVYTLIQFPFGIKLATDIFQQVMDIMLRGLDFAVIYHDDIVINNESQGQHAKHAKKVFERI